MDTLIIDDELKGRIYLETILKRFFSDTVKKIDNLSSVDEAAEYLRTNKPDLIFLDIEMPSKNGFELLKMFPEAEFEVIFTTAYDSYAIRAFQFSALDYLLKPVNKDDLSRALEKASEKISRRSKPNPHYKVLLENLKNAVNPFHKISIPTVHGFEFIQISDIIRMEAQGNYTSLFLNDKRQILSSRTLKEFDNLLSEMNFFRVHKSHLINLACIKSYQRGEGGVVTMNDGQEVEVSKRNKEAFLKQLTTL
jgi:two-component system LytT family response regulator